MFNFPHCAIRTYFYTSAYEQHKNVRKNCGKTFNNWFATDGNKTNKSKLLPRRYSHSQSLFLTLFWLFYAFMIALHTKGVFTLATFGWQWTKPRWQRVENEWQRCHFIANIVLTFKKSILKSTAYHPIKIFMYVTPNSPRWKF